MKKIALYCLLLILVLSFSAYGNSVEFIYTSIDDLYMMEYGGIFEVDKLAFKVCRTTIYTFKGDFSKTDILGGFNFEYLLANGRNTHNIILAGIRLGETQNGTVINLVSRIDLSEKVFLDDNLEFVFWPNGVNAMLFRGMLGYELAEGSAIKGGITYISSEGHSDFGLSVGSSLSF